jgi:hypothetical protein
VLDNTLRKHVGSSGRWDRLKERASPNSRNGYFALNSGVSPGMDLFNDTVSTPILISKYTH